MSAETHLSLIRALHGIWSTGDLSRLEAIYAPDFTAYWPPSAERPVRRGLDGVRFGVRAVRDAFPDWVETIADIFAAGDRVASRCVCQGTHLGPFAGAPPTGRRIEVHDISIFRIAEGRVVEQWCMIDEVGRLRQLAVGEARLREIFGLTAAGPGAA